MGIYKCQKMGLYLQFKKFFVWFEAGTKGLVWQAMFHSCSMGITTIKNGFFFVLSYHNNQHIMDSKYLDDILITYSNPTLVATVIKKLDTNFYVENLRLVSFFLGIEAIRDKTCLHLTLNTSMIYTFENKIG